MVIFDLDGTLYQTRETCLPTLREACEKFHLAPTSEDIKSLLCTTTDAFLNKLAPDMPLDQKNEFKNYMKWREIELVKEQGQLFPYIKEMLLSLVADGEKLAVCSMGSREYVEAVLKRCGIWDCFSFVAHRVNGLSKSESLGNLLEQTGVSPRECLMIGDSLGDLTAAKQYDIPFIGVEYGYGTEDLMTADALAKDGLALQGLIYQFLIFSKIAQDIYARETPITLGISGVDTAGKTTFANNLAQYLRHRGRHVQLVHVDDFLNPSSIRRADDTAQGYLRNAFNLEKLAEVLTDLHNCDSVTMPLLDFRTDSKHGYTFEARENSVIIVEGVLLYRPPIDAMLDYKIYLDISFDEVLRRAQIRDVPQFGPAFLERYKQKYIPAQQLYMEQYHPKENCQLLIDNRDFNCPKITC